MSNSVQPYAARHAPLSMEFSRQEYWSGLLYPLPGDLPNPGIEPSSPMSPALAGGLFTTSGNWEAPGKVWDHEKKIIFVLSVWQKKEKVKEEEGKRRKSAEVNELSSTQWLEHSARGTLDHPDPQNTHYWQDLSWWKSNWTRIWVFQRSKHSVVTPWLCDLCKIISLAFTFFIYQRQELHGFSLLQGCTSETAGNVNW